MTTAPEDLLCSFCLRPRADVGRLVASPLAAICLGCARGAVDLHAAGPNDGPLPATPWEQLSDDELLARIPEVARAGAEVEEHLATWVGAARERGLSWARIGGALGMTRQSAWERFAPAAG